MKIKKFLLLVLVLGMSQAYAQEKKDRAMLMTDRLDEKVQLTEDQKTQIYSINQELVTEIKAIRSESKETSREQMGDLRKNSREQIKAILTPEQLAELDKLKEERKNLRKAAKNDIKAYRKENVLPVMVDKRMRIEGLLSESEKAQLSEARVEIKAIKKEIRREGDKVMRPHKNVTRGHVMNEDIKKIVDEKVQPVIDSHRAELDQINSELAIEKDVWKRDVKAIKEKHQGDKGEHPKVRKGNRVAKHKDSEKAEMRKKQGEVRFMLMDPERAAKRLED